MVKKVTVIACLSASLLIFLATIDFVHGLIMFLMAGIIPGTNFALSATQMLVIVAILTGIAVYRLGVTPLLRSKLEQKSADKKSAVKTAKRLRRA